MADACGQEGARLFGGLGFHAPFFKRRVTSISYESNFV